MKGSPRLEALLECVDRSDSVADIGCDHAWLPCAAVLRGAPHAIGVDKRPGALAQGRRRVSRWGLHGRVSLRLGHGLEPLGPKEVSQVIIAGMGGRTILDILRSEIGLRGVQTLVLQPNTEERQVRRRLRSAGWALVDELLPEGPARTYPTMRWRRSSADEPPWTPLQELLGPRLLERTPSTLARLVGRWCEHFGRQPPELRDPELWSELLDLRARLALKNP